MDAEARADRHVDRHGGPGRVPLRLPDRAGAGRPLAGVRRDLTGQPDGGRRLASQALAGSAPGPPAGGRLAAELDAAANGARDPGSCILSGFSDTGEVACLLTFSLAAFPESATSSIVGRAAFTARVFITRKSSPWPASAGRTAFATISGRRPACARWNPPARCRSISWINPPCAIITSRAPR